MRIVSARVEGFRSIAALEIDFDGLTALVGSGGVGKSAFLRAVNWFFEGGGLESEDLHRPLSDDETAAERVIVAITFADLNDLDRNVLGRYASEEPTTLTRSWKLSERSSLLSGTALAFPPFDPVREVDSAAELKRLYKELHADRGDELDLPAPINRKDDLLAAMEAWERKNPNLCVARTEDAGHHLLGAVGTPLLNDCFKYVFVEATADAVELVSDSRGTPLDRLLETIGELDERTEDQIASLQDQAHTRMQELIATARAPQLERIAAGLTVRMDSYVAGAEVELLDVVERLRRPGVSVRAQLRDGGGHATDVARQGHGLQRALVIAVLHELAEFAAMQEDDADGEATREQAPSLMLAIEEPELYQHPLQARALAGTLEELVGSSQRVRQRSVQVTYSTHSAHFVQPALFQSLRLCRKDEVGQTTSVAASKERISEILKAGGFDGELGGKVERTLAVQLSEAVFARVVLLCEGPSDALTLEAVGARNGGLDREGIAVVCGRSKSLLPIAYSILKQLSIPTYLLFDADVGKRDRPAELDGKERAQAEADARNAAEQNRRLLTLCEEDAAEWPEQIARPASANFADNLETYLEEEWDEMTERMRRVAHELGMDGKSAAVYRQATLECDSVPTFLTDVLSRARALT
jgi:putative ATP-dependent endonuclease of the OLD family